MLSGGLEVADDDDDDDDAASLRHAMQAFGRDPVVPFAHGHLEVPG